MPNLMFFAFPLSAFISSFSGIICAFHPFECKLIQGAGKGMAINPPKVKKKPGQRTLHVVSAVYCAQRRNIPPHATFIAAQSKDYAMSLNVIGVEFFAVTRASV